MILIDKSEITENFLRDQSIPKQLVNCQFTTKYWNFEINKEIDYCCEKEDILNSGLCIFHDNNYLQDKDSRKQNPASIKKNLFLNSLENQTLAVLNSLEKQTFCQLNSMKQTLLKLNSMENQTLAVLNSLEKRISQLYSKIPQWDLH